MSSFDVGKSVLATNVHLTPDLEHFVRGCVESGQYNNVSEVVRSALHLLKDQEDHKRAFMDMLNDVRREARTSGTYSVDSVADEMDAIIANEN
jgi:antitoxin ParD1/3/4